MAYIKWFQNIGDESLEQVGGKGLNLGKMARQNFPVPPGFVVTAQAYFKYMEDNDLQNKICKVMNVLDVENTEKLGKTTEEARGLILAGKMSEELETEIIMAYKKMSEKKIAWLTSSEEEYVAVRSSATAEDLPGASFAGQQDTYLNIHGKQALLEAVKKCWASLFTARATYYRKQKGFPTEKVGIAVVVQKMVNSNVSGIMFTADPTGDETTILIEAGYGLGETIVGGKITPDTYTVDKGSLHLTEKKVHYQEWKLVKSAGENKRVKLSEKEGSKQKIEDPMIIKIAKIGKQIENHYKKPQDIEFAIEANEIYIVQSRPITTLELSKKVRDRGKIEGNIIIEGLAASPGVASGKVKVVPSAEQVNKVMEGDILVTTMTNPDWVPIMKKSAGIITNEGGRTCHAAIVSRELGIPCVVGTENGTEKLKDEQEITVNGFDGVVYDGIVKVQKKEEENKELFEEGELDEIERALDKKLETGGMEEDQARKAEAIVEEFKKEDESEMNSEMIEKEKEDLTKFLKKIAPVVKVNVALPEVAEKAAKTGADGVGLLRAEHMITSSGKHPAEFVRQGQIKELVETVKNGIRTVVTNFRGKPVWFRTFDARSDEFRELEGGDKEPIEDNPMLGWHGIRRDLDQEEMLKAQFQAVKELIAEGFHNIGIMLPFLTQVKELKKAKEIAKEVGLNPNGKEFEFGVMIETPASIWIIDELIEEGIDFVSFGTNDLTQLTLGVDRNNEKIQSIFSELHPAVLREIKHVIKKCKKAGVKTSICGQAASNPEMVKHLVEYGIDSISANIDAVENIKLVVLEEEKEQILKTRQKK